MFWLAFHSLPVELISSVDENMKAKRLPPNTATLHIQVFV